MWFRKSHEPVQQLREMEINNIPLGFGRGKLSPLEPISGLQKSGKPDSNRRSPVPKTGAIDLTSLFPEYAIMIPYIPLHVAE